MIPHQQIRHWNHLLTPAIFFLICLGFFTVSSAKKYPEEHFGAEGMKKGPRTLENIQANINRIMPRIYYLYAQSRPGLNLEEGAVLMWLIVDSNGKMTYVNVFKATLNDEIFSDLLEATLSEFTFDKWTKGREKTEIIYPMEFRRDNALNAPRSRARREWDRQRQQEDAENQGQAKRWVTPVMDSAQLADTTDGPVYELESEGGRNLLKKK
jgi:hypothetical protein